MQKVPPQNHQIPQSACRCRISGSISLRFCKEKFIKTTVESENPIVYLSQFSMLSSVSPFPHGTYSLSVIRNIQAQRSSPPFFRQSFTCSVLLILCFIIFRLRYRAFTFSGTVFQSVYHLSYNKVKRCLLRVHSPLLTESRLMYFP